MANGAVAAVTQGELLLVPTAAAAEPQPVGRALRTVVSLSLDGVRAAVRTLAEKTPAAERHDLAVAFSLACVRHYWMLVQKRFGDAWPLPPLLAPVQPVRLLPSSLDLAAAAAAAAARLPPEEAGYLLGGLYAALLPDEFRSRHGVFYTPPSLAGRLLDQAAVAGVDWGCCSALDPACGGGAFLAPVARRMADALLGQGRAPADVVASIGSRLRGFEIDPFSAWVSQVFAQVAVMEVCRSAGCRLPTLVKVCDALAEAPPSAPCDVVVGNPPYGRVSLLPEQRARFRRGLFGHANLYGLFTELAVGFVRPQGIVAYVTPTSFLAGEYFKALRALLVEEAPPVSLDFVASRRGVFDDVLQETLLAVYRRRGRRVAVRIHALQPLAGEALAVHEVGAVPLASESGEPWLLPRTREQAALVERLRRLPHRLQDYGYAVSTGQLVWNRHKDQLRTQDGPGCYPLIWAEAVSPDGGFVERVEKRGRWPFVEPRAGQDWLLTRRPCVLLQRTTAKEQRRRLVAAELPLSLIRQHGAVVVENHLNIVRAVDPQPRVPPAVLRALLTCEVVDQAFRCLNGSVAVSAYELESLPLPPPDALAPLREAVERGDPGGLVDLAARRVYLKAAAP